LGVFSEFITNCLLGAHKIAHPGAPELLRRRAHDDFDNSMRNTH